MSDFLQRLESEIQNRRLFRRGENILVAVSGGLDSMALLGALHALAGKWRWRIVVAHFNHQLRGRASDADERLVRQAAAKRKWPVVVGRADVSAFAQRAKLSVEMAARKLRHEFFARAAKERNILSVALAHHADDQVELFFLRLLRGAGSEGLAGMKWLSASPWAKSVRLVRPLLGFTKEELREFARENKIRFREDATNFSTDFLRNRIRHELLPRLRKNYQPSLNRTILRTMEILGAEAEFVGKAARTWERRQFTGAKRQPKPADRTPARREVDFAQLPSAVQRRVLQMELAEKGVAADFELIESLRRTPDVFVSVGPNISVARDGRGQIKLRVEAKPEFNSDELAVELSNRAGAADFSGRKLTWRVAPAPKFPPAGIRRSRREFFDADKIGGKIVLRHWRPGDRFQPIGLKSPVKLQDLFVNAKIPRGRRRELIVAEAAGGGIFWVEGLRIGELFKLTPRTQRRLLWRWQPVRRKSPARPPG